MQKLLALYDDMIENTVSGWDRIRFRGTIRWLASLQGLGSFMGRRSILLKSFGRWAESITKRIRAACERQAEVLGIPVVYLNRSDVDKEALARQVAAERGVDSGDICMFSAVELCRAPTVKGAGPRSGCVLRCCRASASTSITTGTIRCSASGTPACKPGCL
jgi:hypothetical protein